MKIKRNKPKGKIRLKKKTKTKTKPEQKKMCKENEVATPRFELTQRLSPPRLPSTYKNGKIIDLKHFFLPLTLFEACEAVFIMNSKINWKKMSLNEYFKAILHHLFQCLLFTFVLDARSSSGFIVLAEAHFAVLHNNSKNFITVSSF